MVRVVDVVLPPAAAADPAQVREAAERAAGFRAGEALGMRIVKRSIDGRARRRGFSFASRSAKMGRCPR